jgi:integrase
MTEIKLLEPSMADVLKAIEAASDLSTSKKTHWSCSVRQICIGVGRPPENIPGRWSGVNAAIQQLHHARVGCSPKTLSNHKANLRAGLAWFAGVKGLSKRGTVLSPVWAALWPKISDQSRRKRLSGLIRYASGKMIDPSEVNEEVLDDYMNYRAETTALATDDAARRRIARAWNACVDETNGWPSQHLIEPPVKSLTMTPWEAFPEQLRKDVENYLAGLNKVHRSFNGKRRRPCKQSTIKTRRRELQAFARMAVKQGYPPESLTSLAELLNPSLAEELLEAYWEENGEEPHIYTIDLAWKLLSVARQTTCLPEGDLAKLDEIRAAIEEHRQGGLTEKNLKVIRAVLTEGVWDKVILLARALMEEARQDRYCAPMKAAVNAAIAVAIAILTIAPMRLGNLIRIQLGENLIKPGDIDGPYWLVFPSQDVKNNVTLQFKLLPEVGEIIDEYINDFRPVLARGSNAPWLFPGETGGVKTSRTLSLQITDRVFKATGLRLTVHQFRHAAAAIFIKEFPGQYERARQFLGHTRIETTMRFYVALEMIFANDIFNDIIKKRLDDALEPAE